MAKLKQSKRFMAFYSISFPLHMAEDEIYKAFNYWLTNCRKYYKLDTYLWVSEYQENSTVHYHLLTNKYMRIEDGNRSMAGTLHNMGYLDGRKTTYIKRKTKQEVKGILTLERFNGVHVDEVKGDKMKVIGYMTKYMTKDNNHEYNKQPWHCSRNVSVLATSVGLSESEFNGLWADIEDKNCVPHIYVNDYCTVIYINQKLTDKLWYLPPNKFFKNLKQINQDRYDKALRDCI